jgi:N6-adenosine-specific RNA methylase IME4
MELQIKEEFKNLIPPLTVEEFKQLEDNCIAEGIRDAIVTWQGFIIDGHNRYEIAKKHGLKFRVEQKEVEDEKVVKKWMAKNQLGRRNLADYVMGELYDIIEQLEKEIGKEKQLQTLKKGVETPVLSIVDKTGKHNTQKIIANKLGWSTGKKAQFDVVKKKAPEQVKEKLRNNEITINQAYQEIKKEEKKAERIEVIQKQIEDIESGILPELKGLYDVVSIDPPWPYEGNNKSITSFDAVGRRVANPYPEMSIQEIKEIELPLMNDAVVLLWTTHKFLPDAFDILKTWGLEYKATLVWNKEKIGMGAWLRMQTEFCLLGIKGKPFWNAKDIRDIISEPRREHSRKPEIFYEMVNDITVGRKIDFFSREKRNGWEAFGNDKDKF